MSPPLSSGRHRGPARRAVAALGILALALSLGACTADRETVAGSEVRVGVDAAFTSANPSTGYGRSEVNAAVAYLTGTGFGYLDAEGAFVEDRGFGTQRILAEDPLTVEYRVADDVTWSDGHPIGAADLLLSWAANSGLLNTPEFSPEDYVDPESGRFTDGFPDDVVYFDGAIGGGLELSDGTPRISDDGRAITVTYREPVATWRMLVGPGLPAHVAAAALGDPGSDADPDAADAAVIAAIADGDAGRLAPLARFWNEGWNFATTPDDPALLVASGPYAISSVAGERIELTANPAYHGLRSPGVETLVLRVVPDPLEAVSLLGSGELDILAPPATADTAAALDGLGGEVTVQRASTAVLEHLEVRLEGGRSGVLSDPTVRAAFLAAVPRQQIVDRLIAPLDPDAAVVDSFTVRPVDPGYAAAVAGNGSAERGTPDPATARRLLREAGVADPEVCVLFDPASARRVAEFELLRESAERVGFAVDDCSTPDWQNLLGAEGAYDVALYAWDSRHLPVAAVAAPFATGSAANTTGWSDPRTDELVIALPTADEDARSAALREIDARLWEGSVGLPLYAYPGLLGTSSRLSGVSLSAVAPGVFWNAWEWSPSGDAASVGGNG